MRLQHWLLLVLVVAGMAAVWMWYPGASRQGVVRINFAPASADAVDAFISVNADTRYSGWRGYGWLDATGPRVTGRWPGDDRDTWEARDNLTLITRRGPDGLARSFATGSAVFALDLDPGSYEVWVLSGDAGHLDYLPRDDYRIVVEGETAYAFHGNPARLAQRFETPPVQEQLDHDAIWRDSVAPRFVWRRAVVELQDGQLTVAVEGGPAGVLAGYLGDYAHTEARGGPPRRHAGALNALLVLPYEPGSDTGRRLVDAVDDWRRSDIRRQWPQQPLPAAQGLALSPADRARGYTAYPVNVLETVLPTDRRPQAAALPRYRATPGEYLPVSFAVSPLADLGETRIEMVLQDAAGEQVLQPRDLAPGVVRYAPLPLKRHGRRWQPQPAMILPLDRWEINKDVTRQFWLTYHVPADLPAGLYTGFISIRPAHGEESRLAVSLEVLPFELQRPTHIATGLTYFSPAYASLQDEEAFWARVEAEFADMRTHNMTTVQYTGIHLDDWPRMDRAMRLYRQAGFEQPVYLLESYAVMQRLRREGIDWESAAFHDAYLEIIRDFVEQAEAHNWPPVIINFGDEFTNDGTEEFGAEVARTLRRIPGIVTGADVNGYKEMRLLAPEVDIVGFNEGWDGPTGVNRGKRLLNESTVASILRAGATPWLVNIGMDRFSNGVWLWKMVRLGVRGKVQWIYRDYAGLPYDPFDAEPLRSHAVYPGPAGTTVPSLEYERMRIGLDDLAYLHTLDRLVQAARQHPWEQAEATAAETFLDGLAEGIEPDIKQHRKPGSGNNRNWLAADYRRLRDAVTAHIIALMKARSAAVGTAVSSGSHY